MKKLTLLSVIILSFVQVVSSQNSISGDVMYNNIACTPMDTTTLTTVYLYQGTTLMYQQATGVNGSYSFANVVPGNYTLKANSTLPPGGINAADVLLLFLWPPLSDLQKNAADVNGSGGNYNHADILALVRFIVGQIQNFLPPYVPAPGKGAWVSESFPLTVTNVSIITQDINMLCTGDVNRSFIP